MKRTLAWFRRDLRLSDHRALATIQGDAIGVFVFDSKILSSLPKNDRRLTWIHGALEELDKNLKDRGSRLVVLHGDPGFEIPKLAAHLGVASVVAGEDYEPYATSRDSEVARVLTEQGKTLQLIKDHVVFSRSEISKDDRSAYRVFTPYKSAWLQALRPADIAEAPVRCTWASDRELSDLPRLEPLESYGFERAPVWTAPGEAAALKGLDNFVRQMSDYGRNRDFPAVPATSGLSVHLRFGTISIRACVRAAQANKSSGSEVWLSELIWREFYQMILARVPEVAHTAFIEKRRDMTWPGRDEHFHAWCQGRTGYPIVDAAMRHFNQTGWMHNRLRMIVASFLVKDLLIDWRRGEQYFAQGLLDFDLAANNGGWQWCASTGCDAQPYFRIFNPVSQSQKFDPDGAFIRKNLPESAAWSDGDLHEPHEPIVDHAAQRLAALKLYGA